MTSPKALKVSSIAELDSTVDSLIVISPSLDLLPDEYSEQIKQLALLDHRIGNQIVFMINDEAPAQRLILSPTGALDRDYDDARRYFDAAKKAILEAKLSGSINPAMLVLGSDESKYKEAMTVAFLGACQALWQPLEAREYHGSHIEPVQTITMVGEFDCDYANAIAQGQYVARDLCGTEPERMAPPRFAEYCESLFEGSDISVEVISNVDEIDKHYPMLSTVARASYPVERHHPRVIKLEYVPEGEIERTLMFVGKGLVYDTGGADLKVGGAMAGMSRDKGGAASVAGFMKSLADHQPKGVKVIAYLAVVRNSIGSDCFVPDEIITSREGVRVRIGNTDAEGRLAMGDLLSEMKELAKDEVNPVLFTVATLTGHAARSMGPYTALVENGPSRELGLSQKISAMGDIWADGAEVSRERREDYSFIAPKTLADDVLSSNNAPSAITARGHQFPMAFLAIVSGLDKHGINSDLPIPYIHVDIAGSGVEAGDWQHGKPTAASLSSIYAAFCR